MNQQTRRSFISGVGGALFASAVSARAQSAASPALPLKNLGLEHLDIVVPDTAVSAKFYMQVFRTKLHQQPFQGKIRYFILLGDLPANRQVGYIAIGAGGTRPTSIGHYCALAEHYDRSAMAKEMEAAGYKSASGNIAMWPDPDGIELQLFQPPAGVVTAAVPSDLPVEANGLVTPLGLDHVVLSVRDIDASLPYYHLLYGKEVDGVRQHNPERLWLNLKNDTRIGLQPAPAGQSPRIEHFCIKVRPFDREAVSAGLKKIGAEVLPSTDEPGILRFRDNNKIMVELKAT
jgi:catechol 2,3-dioxygenase-like lactoylglutathione lyase family enzyme/predicted enzyme related to lactoylglutathione lyase